MKNKSNENKRTYRLAIFHLPEILTGSKFKVSFRFESEYYDKCVELSRSADRLSVFHAKADYPRRPCVPVGFHVSLS